MRCYTPLVLALLATSPLLADEPVQHRQMIIKVATEDGAGLSTFDLSDLAIGETRELTADDGRVVTATRDEAGLLLDLGNGKTMRLPVLADGPDGAHAIKVEGGGGRTMVFHDTAGGTTVLESGGDATEGKPHKVMVFHGEDGTTHTITEGEGAEWTGEAGENGQVKIVKKIVMIDGEAQHDVDVIVEGLGAEGASIDITKLQALIEAATAETCPEGEECARKVVVITKEVERTEE